MGVSWPRPVMTSSGGAGGAVGSCAGSLEQSVISCNYTFGDVRLVARTGWAGVFIPQKLANTTNWSQLLAFPSTPLGATPEPRCFPLSRHTSGQSSHSLGAGGAGKWLVAGIQKGLQGKQSELLCWLH